MPRTSRASHPQTTLITANAARNVTFNQSPMAWRGFSEDEVRAFVGRVADTLTAVEQERTGLLAEIERLRNYFRGHGYDPDLDRADRGVAKPAETTLFKHVKRISIFKSLKRRTMRPRSTQAPITRPPRSIRPASSPR